MRGTAMGPLAVILIFTIGCSSPKPKELIVGRWQAVEPKEAKETAMQLEFVADGTLNASFGQALILRGKYKLTGDDLVEIELEPAKEAPEKSGKTGIKKYRLEITKESMSLTPQEGEGGTLKWKKT